MGRIIAEYSAHKGAGVARLSVLVRYADVAMGAKEAFEISTGKKLPASNVDLIKTEGAEFSRYDIPFELNSMVLDGLSDFLPDEGTAQIGFISEEMANDDADFDTPIVFELSAEVTFASPGIMIVFDEKKNIYATHINIRWYNGDSVLDDEDFYPTRANYFCNKKVEFYNKIIITFYSLNVAKNRLRVNHIEYGLKVEFGADELKSSKIIQEIDPISTSVPINPFDFVVDSKKGIEFSFQTKQPIEVIFNGDKKATTFVKSASRKSKTIWDIKSEDYIGLMDTIYFQGGIYENKNAVELIGEIFSVAKVPYSISSDFESSTVTGYIPYTTCREALMQVIFAIGAVADTSNSDKVNIFALSQEKTQTIPKSRIMQGQSFEDETRVTAVELVSHAYSEISDSIVAYEAEKSGTGENIFVSFLEPLHDLSITNGSIIQSNVNYAIINANVGGRLTGQKYDHTKVVHRKENPLVLSTDIENVITIENATLVSDSEKIESSSTGNVDKLLDMCYNYLVNTERTSMKIVDGRNNANTAVGDLISFETEYLGNKSGRIIKQSFSLSGGILIKDSVVR